MTYVESTAWIITVTLPLFIFWKTAKWLDTERKSRVNKHAPEESKLVQALQAQMQPKGTFRYVPWTWPRVKAVRQELTAHRFGQTYFPLEDCDRGVGYCDVSYPIAGTTLRCWIIPYYNQKPPLVHCHIAIGKVSTPVRTTLEIALIPEKDIDLESRHFNSKYSAHSEDPKVLTATFDPVSMEYFQHLEWGNASVHISHSYIRAEFDLAYDVQKVQEMLRIMERVTRHYISATAGMAEKPKGE